MKRWLIAAAVLVVVGGMLVTARALFAPRSPLPESIHKQVSFVVYIPTLPWRVDKYTYDTASGVLAFTATKMSTSLIFTEQAAPSQFNDIQQYYPTLLNKLNQFDSTGTANGTVNLIKPTELKGKEEAVVYNDGTLVFVNPSKALSKDDWRRLFNNMQVVK